METQTQLLLLQKTMMVAEGVGRMLNPEVNMWQIAQPLVENWARENLGPLPRIRDGLEELWKDVQRLPHVLREAEAYLQRRSVDDTERQKERLAARRRHWRWLVFGWISLIIASGFAFAMMEVYW